MSDLQIGVGLRPTHYPFLETSPTTQIDFFEALSENYMESRGRPREMLLKVRENYPVALHGVGMNLGSTAGMNSSYLEKLKNLVAETEPFLVSDHLCWTGTTEFPTHDLLPLPYTEESIETVSRNILVAQDFLCRPLAIENVSTYMRYKHSEMTEWDFIAAIQKKTGCYLLLDLNNVYVNAKNHDFPPEIFLEGIPLDTVKQIHLAGHTDTGEFLFDTHSTRVCTEVWELLRSVAGKMASPPAILVEWDDEIPEWSVLEAEAVSARNHWEAGCA